jgi:hypothetical protein
MEMDMKTSHTALFVALVAGALATDAFAQTTLPASAYWTKQSVVASVTRQEAEGADMSPQAAGIAANRDKALRGEPRVLTTTAEKEDVVASVTQASIQSINVGARSAGANAVKARATKDEPKALTTTRERQEAVLETTREAAYDH